MKTTTQYQIENIVRMARRHLKLRTMKAAKEMMLNFMKPEEFPVDIDWTRINALFADALAARRIADFTAAIDAAEVAAAADAAHAEAIEADKERTVYRRWGDFFGANDFAARRRIVDQCHAEALRMNAAIDEQQEFLSLSTGLQEALIRHDHREALRLDAQHVDPLDPVATVKPVSESNGRVTYRVSIRGRAYLYTIGDAFAQLRVKQKGGTHHYRTVTSAYMLDQIVRAITRFRA